MLITNEYEIIVYVKQLNLIANGLIIIDTKDSSESLKPDPDGNVISEEQVWAKIAPAKITLIDFGWTTCEPVM